MEDIIVTVFEKYSLPQSRSRKSIGWCPLGFESGCWSRRVGRVEVEGGSCDWASGWVEEGYVHKGGQRGQSTGGWDEDE